MKNLSPSLVDFQIIRPTYESSQQQTLDWIVASHTKAESVKRGQEVTSDEMTAFSVRLRKLLHHVGCKPGVIDRRGHFIPDFLHHRWEEMEVYRLEEDPKGVNLAHRGRIHQEILDNIIEDLYPDNSQLPAHAIHVSCTGYSSPSSMQKVVSRRGGETQVTHAYHMGCYASVPALRIAAGALKLDGGQIDILHTELCALHNNPLQHEAEQLVVQSLFADGVIKYSMLPSDDVQKPHFRLLGLLEEIIPESIESMGWILTDWGFQMILAKEIPLLIKKNVKSFICNFCRKNNVDEQEILQDGIFAIHPGGPRILQHIQGVLELKDEQLASSRKVLNRYGNMSSATIPHIWADILNDQNIPSGKKVLSLAFGPGLTIAGALLTKVEYTQLS